MPVKLLPFELWERILMSLQWPDFDIQTTKLYEVNSMFKEIVFQQKYSYVGLYRFDTAVAVETQRILARAR
jgi:hypothetical protein